MPLMFDRLTADAPDAILQLMQTFRDDPRRDKIDLGVGVFRDDTGATPVMAAVQQAEARILAAQTTKTYTWFAGAPEYGQAIARLVLGDALDPDRLAVAATPGGTGALRMAFDLVHGAGSGAAVWLPAQGWPNHDAMLRHVGLPVRRYAHATADGTLAFDRMMVDLAGARAGDVLLLHGCCHNPTGIDPDIAQWVAIGDMCAARGLLPLVDLAYQGFGDGIDADAAGLRQLARTCPELLVAVSASKTFGVYRDRVGALLGLAKGPVAARLLQGRVDALNRLSISFPPDHGARVVQTVLDDPALRALWSTELDSMRARIAMLRTGLAAALVAMVRESGTGCADAAAGAGRPSASPAGLGQAAPATALPPARHNRRTPDPRFAAIARQRGMFSCLPLNPDQMDRLRHDHAVYATRDGRINIAGLTETLIPALAARIAAVL